MVFLIVGVINYYIAFGRVGRMIKTMDFGEHISNLKDTQEVRTRNLIGSYGSPIKYR